VTSVTVTTQDELRERTQWKVDSSNRYVICAGDGGHEWLRYDRELGDAIFHVEWRFTPREGNPRYNSGVYMRSSLYGEIWHQAQTGQGGGFLFANTLVDGVLKRVNLRNQMKENRVKPAGEWNTYEIRTEGDKISLWVNGATVNELARCAFLKGYLGLEAEGYEITFRNMKLKELR
jgi:hypothetical protein